MSTVALWAAGLVLFAAPFYMAFQSGGYGLPAGDPGSRSQVLVGGVSLVLLAVLAIVVRWPPLPGGLPLVALGALVALGLWTGLSIRWTQILDTAAQDTDRLALYCAVFALGLAAFRVPALRRVAPELLLVGILVVSLYALAGRLLPDVVHQNGVYARLRQPLTYWNALGIFTGFGLLIGVAMAADEAHGLLRRSLACAAAVPCGLAAFLTLSRGAVAAIVAGLIVLVVVHRGRSSLVAVACALVPVIALAALLAAFPDVLELRDDRSAQATQGAVYLPIAVLATVAAGIGFAWLSRGRLAAFELRLRPREQAALAAGAVLLVLGAGFAISSRSTEKTATPTHASRLARAETNRGHYWRVSLRAFGRHPINGVGSGSFAAVWAHERGRDQPAVDAHSLYLETLAELGLVGAFFLLVFIGAIAVGVGRAVRAAPDASSMTAAAAVLAAFAVHAGLDWDWEMPAVSLIPLILAAAVLHERSATPAA